MHSSSRRAEVACPAVPLDRSGEALDLTPVRELLTRIERRYHPEQIWLFGSRARGDARPRSDWDLLVVLADDAPEGDLDPVEAWRLQSGLRGVYADVVLIRAGDFRESLEVVNTLPYVVGTEGVLLHAR